MTKSYDPYDVDDSWSLPYSESPQYFQCECYSNEHTLKFSLDEDGTIYTSVFLHSFYPWYKRIWIAIKYIFGYNSVHGHWDCFDMNPNDYNRFRRLLSVSEHRRMLPSN